ncbi:hypothetical protein EWM64_g6090 [Hericium alpestre]|uniref:Protein kinase domain-containing protein n=1 Tax=Hericium alpestre TaxID=135208 RepID=A0A4Y9ZUS6_9AGAM|nr:hypothetical protein EWM64_g6090 [Hericium alpestre]
MSDLYHLRRPVRQILTEWLDIHPPTPKTFEGVPRNNLDYVFNANPETAFLSKGADQVEPAFVPKFKPGTGIPLLEFDPEKLEVGRRLSDSRSENNFVYEVKWNGEPYVLKVNHQTIDDQENKRDRHLVEMNAYHRLLQSELCKEGVVPRPHGYFHIWGRQHPGWARTEKRPYETSGWLEGFTNPAEYPRAILFERIPNVTWLSRDQFTRENIFDLFDTLARLHAVGVIQGDMDARNVLWDGTRFVLVDFDKAIVYPERERVSKTQCSRDLIKTWENFMFDSW